MAPTATAAQVPTTTNGLKTRVPSRLYSVDHASSLEAFKELTSRETSRKLYPLSADVVKNIPIYDLSRLSPSSSSHVPDLLDEWNHILLSGSGVLILRNFEQDHNLINKINEVFDSIISDEAATSKGDHFATSGNNSRIWNSFQKHAERDPSSFIRYYSNPWLSLICESWLGVAYQITAQVNIVKPGGQPQVAHRDYHLGFQTAESCARFPRAMQIASQLLTLQGAVAHTDMPLESGPTRFLPFSQQFEEGYMAYRRPEFVEHFNQNWVSAELKKGDAVFFNPALFHAAGENRTSGVERSANLLQISSAFGKTMETIDTLTIVEKCWDAILELAEERGVGLETECAIAAISNGYPFPTNLDKRPPAPGGMAPESETDVLRRALEEKWDTSRVVAAMRELQDDCQP